MNTAGIQWIQGYRAVVDSEDNKQKHNNTLEQEDKKNDHGLGTDIILNSPEG
jgi:hypothetical protein